MESSQPQMKKNLGWLTATSIVVGCVIGTGNGFLMAGSRVACVP